MISYHDYILDEEFLKQYIQKNKLDDVDTFQQISKTCKSHILRCRYSNKDTIEQFEKQFQDVLYIPSISNYISIYNPERFYKEHGYNITVYKFWEHCSSLKWLSNDFIRKYRDSLNFSKLCVNKTSTELNSLYDGCLFNTPIGNNHKSHYLSMLNGRILISKDHLKIIMNTFIKSLDCCQTERNAIADYIYYYKYNRWSIIYYLIKNYLYSPKRLYSSNILLEAKDRFYQNVSIL